MQACVFVVCGNTLRRIVSGESSAAWKDVKGIIILYYTRKPRMGHLQQKFNAEPW
jgi:hypothetical protein